MHKAHVKSALIGASVTIPIKNGKLVSVPKPLTVLSHPSMVGS